MNLRAISCGEPNLRWQITRKRTLHPAGKNEEMDLLIFFFQPSKLIKVISNSSTPMFSFRSPDLSEANGVENILSPVRATHNDEGVNISSQVIQKLLTDCCAMEEIFFVIALFQFCICHSHMCGQADITMFITVISLIFT